MTHRALTTSAAALAACVLVTTTAQARVPKKRTTTVCVEIEMKSWTPEGVAPPPSPPPTAPATPPPGPSEPATPTPELGDPEEKDSTAPKSPEGAKEDAPEEGADDAKGASNEVPPAPVTLPEEGEVTDTPSVGFGRFGAPRAYTDPSQYANRQASDGTFGDETAASLPPDEDERGIDPEEADLFVVDPELYLRRLIEHRVTHEPGFESSRKDCKETLTVELYPVRRGWTVFARYSGFGREEKVDRVRLDEFAALSERLTTALLHDKPVARTLTRTTVLRADSETRGRRIKARPHFMLGMGSAVRVGNIPTAQSDTNEPAADELRPETPLAFQLGARSKFRAWALDAFGRLNVGTTERASRRNRGGGHVDYSLGFGLGLAFLAYGDPDGINSMYFGGGGSFDVSRYQVIGASTEGSYSGEPNGLWGGGLNVDLLIGYEFMRASALHFFVEAKVSAPAFVFVAENDDGAIESYIPSALGQVGLLF